MKFNYNLDNIRDIEKLKSGSRPIDFNQEFKNYMLQREAIEAAYLHRLDRYFEIMDSASKIHVF